MADTSTVEGRQKVLEGLWLIGIEPTSLDVSPGLPESDFLAQLRGHGVGDEFVKRAGASVEWRAPKGNEPLDQRVADLLRAAGYRQDEVQAFLDRSRSVMGDPTGDAAPGILRVLTEQFNDRTAGAMLYKATGGKDTKGAAWNPFRTDEPPKGADAKYGSRGIMSTQAKKWDQDPMAGPAGTRVAQLGQLPIPPTEVQKKQAAAKAPAPAAPAAKTSPAGPTVQQQIDAALAADRAKNMPKKPQTPEEQEAWVKSHFGADAWFLDVPEVRKILMDLAATGSTDGEEAARQVTATQWYKTTSATARAWVAQKRRDPATILSDIEEQASFLNSQATEMGLEIPPDRLKAIAESSLRFGWSPQQIKGALGAEFHYDPKSGKQATKINEMKAMAQKYLVPLSDDALQSWGKALLTGTQNDAQFQEYVKGMSKSLFPQLSAAIDAGHTVADYVDPYKQVAAQTLEMPSAGIDFMDPKWRKALEQKDPKTGQIGVMTLSEWSSTLKTDKQYGYDKTTQGVDEAAKLATSILKKFGKIS